jgi:hypothetical protein
MRKTLFVGFLVVCAVMLFSGSAVLAADSWIGTWKLDVAKSKFSPGPAPKSLTLTFASTPDGIKHTSDGVNAEGKATYSEFVSKFDGKEVPYKGNPNADTAAPKRIDDNSYENTWKKDGKVTITAHAVVSKDGKTLTVHQKGKNAKGEAVDSTAVFEKQ